MGKESLEQAQKPASQPGIGFGIGYREVSALLGKKTDLCEEHRGYISCWEQRRACAGAGMDDMCKWHLWIRKRQPL